MSRRDTFVARISIEGAYLQHAANGTLAAAVRGIILPEEECARANTRPKGVIGPKEVKRNVLHRSPEGVFWSKSLKMARKSPTNAS